MSFLQWQFIKAFPEWECTFNLTTPKPNGVEVLGESNAFKSPVERDVVHGL